MVLRSSINTPKNSPIIIFFSSSNFLLDQSLGVQSQGPTQVIVRVFRLDSLAFSPASAAAASYLASGSISCTRRGYLAGCLRTCSVAGLGRTFAFKAQLSLDLTEADL